MEMWFFITLIVLIGCGTGVLTEYFKHQRAVVRSRPPSDLEEELEALRQRVQVLEQIVTDQSFELKREFDRLERHG